MEILGETPGADRGAMLGVNRGMSVLRLSLAAVVPLHGSGRDG